MGIALLLLAVTILVSYANGANDNFKGVATLYGSGTSTFRTALIWANGTTLAGALAAVLLGHGLAAAFTGKGLVPLEIVTSGAFLCAVGMAAAGTVLLATKIGMPISTTHALMGSLVGAGLVAAPASFQFSTLGTMFLLPLIAGPLAAFAVTVAIIPACSRAGRRLGITGDNCACVRREEEQPVPAGGVGLAARTMPSIKIGTVSECREDSAEQMVGISVRSLIKPLHFASAGAVGFARGLNDAPKIGALALGGAFLPFHQIIVLTAFGMLIGGMIGARRIAETMSHRITDIQAGDGLKTNAVTASLVLLASSASLPLSTTHVSCGALFGLGAVTGAARRKMIAGIIASWVATLPVAALLAIIAYTLLK